jgi:hypothetical protein
VASGPEGDVAVLTDAKGGYQFRALPIGNYTVRFHRNEVLAEREATVSVDKVVRVNMRLPAVPAQVEIRCRGLQLRPSTWDRRASAPPSAPISSMAFPTAGPTWRR